MELHLLFVFAENLELCIRKTEQCQIEGTRHAKPPSLKHQICAWAWNDWAVDGDVGSI